MNYKTSYILLLLYVSIKHERVKFQAIKCIVNLFLFRFDLANCNLNDEFANKMNPHDVPDVVRFWSLLSLEKLLYFALLKEHDDVYQGCPGATHCSGYTSHATDLPYPTQWAPLAMLCGPSCCAVLHQAGAMGSLDPRDRERKLWKPRDPSGNSSRINGVSSSQTRNPGIMS